MPIVKDFHHILHGGDYNPDQWLHMPEVIDADFQLMDKAHCNTFSVAIFSWGQLEPREGVYEFGWLDDIFARAQKSGKKLFLATPSAARPGWMGQKYPETSYICENGQRMPWSHRQTHCPSSKVMREKTAGINRVLAERYASHPALAGWHISNEYSGHCYCPDCKAKFYDFLRERYGTLENLNKHYWSGFWGHTLTAWNQISPTDSSINVVRLDWMRFSSENILDFFKMEIAAVREFSDAPLTTNMMGLYGNLDYWKFAKECDFIADDCYPTWYNNQTEAVAANFAALHDMHYAMLGKPWLMMESCPGIPQYKPHVKLRRPNEFQREMLLALGHGADGTMYFQWRKGLGNCEQHHGAVVGHDGSDRTLAFRSIAEYGAKLDNIAEIIDSKKRPDAAVILDWESRWCLDFASGFTSPDGKGTDKTIFTHYQSLWSHNADLAVIDSDQDFSSYKMIVAPMLYMLKDGVSERLEAFVRNGGTLVMTYLSAWVDESNRAFFGGNPGGPALRRLFGIWNEDIDGFEPTDAQSILYKGSSYKVHEFAELIHLEGAEMKASFGGQFYAGSPAVTVNRFGKGKAVYIAGRTDIDFLNVLYSDLMAEAEVKPVLDGIPPQIKVSRRIAADGTCYFFVLNMTDSEQKFVLPCGMTDIWNGGSRTIHELALPSAGSTVLKVSGDSIQR